MDAPAYRCQPHTYQRMEQRGIQMADIEAVLSSPDSYTPDPSQRSVRLDRRIGGRVLKVWVKEPWPPKFMQLVVVKSAAWKD